MSFSACADTTITNVQTVISFGFNSLVSCQLIGVQRIISVDSQASIGTTISDIEIDNFELYCQNDDSMCYEIANSTG